jgi:hypothetical protein
MATLARILSVNKCSQKYTQTCRCEPTHLEVLIFNRKVTTCRPPIFLLGIAGILTNPVPGIAIGIEVLT